MGRLKGKIPTLLAQTVQVPQTLVFLAVGFGLTQVLRQLCIFLAQILVFLAQTLHRLEPFSNTLEPSGHGGARRPEGVGHHSGGVLQKPRLVADGAGDT